MSPRRRNRSSRFARGAPSRRPGRCGSRSSRPVSGCGRRPLPSKRLASRRGFTHPAGRPELEDFVEWCAKALRAADPISLRVAARGVGEEAPALLRDLNPPEAVRSRVDAVRVALAYRTAPEGWADDLAVVLGLEPRDDAGVHAAVARLARGALALLRERNSPIGDWAPELNRYLHDGTLERHLSGGGPT
jgi:hypothetical protein